MCNHAPRRMELPDFGTTIKVSTDSFLCLSPDTLSSAFKKGYNCDSVNFRYIIYSDSTICSPCELGKMGIWRSIERNTKDIGVKVDYIFIFSPSKSKTKELINAFYKRSYKFRLHIDTLNVLERENPMISHSFSCLLDKNDTIVFIGNPAKNEAIERNYYKFLIQSKRQIIAKGSN